MATGRTSHEPLHAGRETLGSWCIGQADSRSSKLLDLEPNAQSFLSDVLRGLRRPRKKLSCKFLYDWRGSELFDRICSLPEYYPTRTELQIMQQHVQEMVEAIGPDCLLIEYGSGSSLKTRLLLDCLRRPAAYVPIDISRSHLLSACEQLRAAYPDLHVLPVCGDYTSPLRLPVPARTPASRVVYFPGSTIGNFVPAEAVRFLARTRRLVGPGGGLLIGVDLKKDPRVLHAAYNDSAGVTAEFNLNLMARINRELRGTFNLGCFAHYAPYNPRLGRMEMHLVSGCYQEASVAGEAFEFMPGETILTECSYKYTLDEFEELATLAGYRPQLVWTDRDELFSVQYFVAE